MRMGVWQVLTGGVVRGLMEMGDGEEGAYGLEGV